MFVGALGSAGPSRRTVTCRTPPDRLNEEAQETKVNNQEHGTEASVRLDKCELACFISPVGCS
jgi:hypothetical protein